MAQVVFDRLLLGDQAEVLVAFASVPLGDRDGAEEQGRVDLGRIEELAELRAAAGAPQRSVSAMERSSCAAGSATCEAPISTSGSAGRSRSRGSANEIGTATSTAATATA